MFTSKHGGVLIGIRNQIEHEQVNLSIVHDDYVAIKIYNKPKPILICCVYNPPTGSPFIWSSGQLSNLLYQIELIRSNQIFENTILTGDINFSKTEWESMSASDDFENAFIENMFELNFLNIAKRQFDVVLVNNLDPKKGCELDKNLFSKYPTNQKPCSDKILEANIPKVTRHRVSLPP